jgi:hypothetical protein
MPACSQFTAGRGNFPDNTPNSLLSSARDEADLSYAGYDMA